ncbi:MAG: hypothetical protein DRO11_00625 [Methanobacteriota archaeon]|nr:MAG: hypothetical protein DRO11_00625 [Euryarchaeota archaeon]
MFGRVTKKMVENKHDMDEKGFIFTMDAILAMVPLIIIVATVANLGATQTAQMVYIQQEDSQTAEAILSSLLADGILPLLAIDPKDPEVLEAVASNLDNTLGSKYNYVLALHTEYITEEGEPYFGEPDFITARIDGELKDNDEEIRNVLQNTKNLISASRHVTGTLKGRGWIARAYAKIEDFAYQELDWDVRTILWNFHNWYSNFQIDDRYRFNSGTNCCEGRSYDIPFTIPPGATKSDGTPGVDNVYFYIGLMDQEAPPGSGGPPGGIFPDHYYIVFEGYDIDCMFRTTPMRCACYDPKTYGGNPAYAGELQVTLVNDTRGNTESYYYPDAFQYTGNNQSATFWVDITDQVQEGDSITISFIDYAELRGCGNWWNWIRNVRLTCGSQVFYTWPELENRWVNARRDPYWPYPDLIKSGIEIPACPMPPGPGVPWAHLYVNHDRVATFYYNDDPALTDWFLSYNRWGVAPVYQVAKPLPQSALEYFEPDQPGVEPYFHVLFERELSRSVRDVAWLSLVGEYHIQTLVPDGIAWQRIDLDENSLIRPNPNVSRPEYTTALVNNPADLDTDDDGDDDIPEDANCSDSNPSYLPLPPTANAGDYEGDPGAHTARWRYIPKDSDNDGNLDQDYTSSCASGFFADFLIPIPDATLLDAILVLNTFGGVDSGLIQISGDGENWVTLFDGYSTGEDLGMFYDRGYGYLPGTLYIRNAILSVLPQSPDHSVRIRVYLFDYTPSNDWDYVGIDGSYVFLVYTDFPVEIRVYPFENEQNYVSSSETPDVSQYITVNITKSTLGSKPTMAHLFLGLGSDTGRVVVEYATDYDQDGSFTPYEEVYDSDDNEGEIPYYVDLTEELRDPSDPLHLRLGTIRVRVKLWNRDNNWPTYSQSGEPAAEIFSGTRLSIVYPRFLKNEWAFAYASRPEDALMLSKARLILKVKSYVDEEGNPYLPDVPAPPEQNNMSDEEYLEEVREYFEEYENNEALQTFLDIVTDTACYSSAETDPKVAVLYIWRR